MAYQRSTQAQGFKSRVVPTNEVKNYTDLAKSLEKERKESVKGFQGAAKEQITEMTRLSTLEQAEDVYELNNLREFSKSLNTALDTVAKTVIKPITQGQIQDGINTAIRCQQGDTEACELVKLNDEQELAIQAQVAKQRTEINETANNIEKEWDEAGYEAELRQKYRLLNLKKQNSNFALGYRRGILMEAATGYDAWRDGILTGSSDDFLVNSTVEHEGEQYKVSDYYNIQNTDVKEKIVASLQNAYITRHGSGLSQFMVNKYLTEKVVERTNIFNQNEFTKGQREWANTQLEYYEDQFQNFNFNDLDSESGELTAQLGVQEFINNSPAIMEALSTEGSRNAASKAKLIDFLVETLKSEKFQNMDDSEQLLTFLEKPLFYIAGISKKKKDGTYELSSLSDLFGNDLDTDALRKEVLLKIAEESRAEILGKKTQLKERIDKLYIDSGTDEASLKLSLIELYQNEDYYGKYWANEVFNDYDSKFEFIPTLGVEESKKIMRKLEREFDTKNGGIINIFNVNLQRIDHDVLQDYKERGLLGDPYGGNKDARTAHEAGRTTLESLAKVVFDKKDLPEELATYQTEAFISFISPKILALANRHSDLTGSSLEDSISYATNYYAQKFRASNTDVFGEVDMPQDIVGDKDTTSLTVTNEGFHNDIYTNNALGFTSADTLTANYVDTIRLADTTVSNTNGYIFKNEYIVKNDAFYALVDGRPGKIFNALSMVDALSTHPAVIYNDQIVLHGGEAVEWSPAIQAEIKAWEELTKDTRKALVSNDDVRVNNALKNEGFISLTDMAHTLITPDGSIPVNESEYASLLIRAGVSETYTYEEFLGRPDLVEKVIKRKLLDGIEIIQGVTNNQNEFIRRLTAHMITGDHENWNKGDFKNYTLEALNAYSSGNNERLNSLFNNNGLSLNSFSVEVPIARDYIDTDPKSVLNTDLTSITSLEELEGVLAKLNELEVPEQKINIREYTMFEQDAGVISHQLRRILGLGWEREPNVEYERYITFKENLEDKIGVIKLLQNHSNRNFLSPVGDFIYDTFLRVNFVDPSKVLEYQFYPAVEGIIGKERLEAIKEKADGDEDAILELLKLEPEFAGVTPTSDLEASGFSEPTKEQINAEKRLDLEIEMLDIIHSGESTVGNYEAFNQGGAKDGTEVLGFSGAYSDHPANTGKKLTEMSIGEILAIQDSGYNTKLYPFTEEGWEKWFASGGIHAAGRYQFTREGLREALKRSGLKETDLFNEENQDKLAMILLLELGPSQWTSMIGNEKLEELIKKYKAIK